MAEGKKIPQKIMKKANIYKEECKGWKIKEEIYGCMERGQEVSCGERKA